MKTRRTASLPYGARRAAGLFLILLWTAGCALSPQVVDIRPPLQAPADAAGSGDITLALAVSDGRDSPVLGRRGGVYEETATISTADDISGPLRRSLAAALEQMGYRITAGDDAMARLTVSLTRLDYAVQKHKLSRTVTTGAAIEAVLRKGAKSYSNTYKLSRSRKLLTAPDAKDNEEMINETLAAVLQRLLDDKELWGRLQEPAQAQ